GLVPGGVVATRPLTDDSPAGDELTSLADRPHAAAKSAHAAATALAFPMFQPIGSPTSRSASDPSRHPRAPVTRARCHELAKFPSVISAAPGPVLARMRVPLVTFADFPDWRKTRRSEMSHGGPQWDGPAGVSSGA